MKRQHDEKHLRFIRDLPCVICGNNIETEATHVRFTCAQVGKLNPGIGRKPDDCWTVPLCGKHHREQHTGNEKTFWRGYSIDPLRLALALHRITGDHDLGVCIVVANCQAYTALAREHHRASRPMNTQQAS